MNAGIWMHYKGGLYLLLGLARHTENEEELVIYVTLNPKPGQTGAALQARPLSMWEDLVEVDSQAGRVEVPRFRYLGARRV